ncbi:TIGR02266 family protein [Anaeromyxobacter sp. Fw109-5]|uniref:TIGR02266 family protein n=1 Tax=Anaeromyxobacter sp. (strain Fw109-5) TaxID=404589 RepID=UPI0000ED6DEB|nr:TIGR02266 family protein [Anaeromyxobacter sp. Fw109-5]ABS28528.1 response regulator receiver modulated PilZ sensor protein [Anaeromyxobacter sp. Fw109-5]
MEIGREKRRDPRVPLVLRVDYPGMQQAVRDVTENVSAGGLFIRTDRDLREGDRVPLQVSFPGLLEPVEVEVEVVRRRPAGQDQARGVAVKVPVDRVDDRHKLARIAETARTGLGRAKRTYRVLVVEDNARVVEMYQYALRKLRSEGENGVDVAVEYAPNGHEALARLVEPPPIDLVMADLYMPVMDGFALVERMRADPALAGTPIVIISAGGPDARDRAAELGIDVYLQKPVQFADIIATVSTLLRIR